MAKNYTISEAVRIINAGTDMEAITDIGRRYPILLHKVSKVAAIAGESFVDLMNFMPEHLTANKVNTLMKNNVEVEADEEAEDAVVEDDKPAEKKAAKTKATKTESTGSDYESMSGKELWDILGKAGKRKDCKDKMGGTKKDDMIAYINKYGLGETEVEETETDEEVETSENPYDGISAPELFKECKKRGIKAAPKKPAKYYVELLVKSDEEVESEPEEAEDDDWGDEPEEKSTKKAEPEKKPAKKAAKKEETADDDDDWDI